MIVMYPITSWGLEGVDSPLLENSVSSLLSILPPLSSEFPISGTDPGRIGFMDDIGGEVDGLMSCTETLGSESCYDGWVDEVMEKDCERNSRDLTVQDKRLHEKRLLRELPPPISSLDINGHRSFYLRPRRKNGRLELTRVERVETLRTSREGGRLRLRLIEDDEEEEDGGEEKEEEKEEDEDAMGDLRSTEIFLSGVNDVY